MHNHKGNDGKMMWLMMLPCLLMIIFVVFLGNGIGSSLNWQFFAGIILMISAHALMMKFMHNHEDLKNNKEIEDSK